MIDLVQMWDKIKLLNSNAFITDINDVIIVFEVRESRKTLRSKTDMIY